MTAVNLDELHAIATVAHDRGWNRAGDDKVTADDIRSLGLDAWQAEHIAAAAPDVVLALIARVHEFEGAVRRVVERDECTAAAADRLDALLAKGTVL